MSTTRKHTSEASDIADRILDVIEVIVTDKTGLKIRIHAFVVTLALSLSLATAPTVGVTPSITAKAWRWAVAAVLVAVLQGIALLVPKDEIVTVSSVATSMLCFAISFMTIYDAPTSFVGAGFLSLGLCCLLPTLRSLFEC